MAEFLNMNTLNCIYFALLGVGFLYAIIILISGGLHDINLPDFDVDVGDIGGVDMPDVHMDFDAAPSFDHGEIGVTPLSPITIASFITAFGAFGIVATQLFSASAQFSLVWAAGGGLIVAAIAHFAFGFLLSTQASSEVRRQDIVGATAEVITPIPAGGLGQIAFVARGGRVTYSARSEEETAIRRGTVVTIVDVVGNVALVRPRHKPPPSTD